MYYKLPEDIRKTIYELEESYPFFKPERFRKSYYTHLRNYHKRGFWSAITWGLDHAVILYIYAALNDLDIWCQGVLENVKPGTWHTKAENLNVNCWGNRCSALIAWHEDVEEPNDFEETDICVGVDSGQAGIYDYNHFAHIKDDEERDERWYDSIETFRYKRIPVTPVGRYLIDKIKPLHQKRITLEKELDGLDSKLGNRVYQELFHQEMELKREGFQYGIYDESLDDYKVSTPVNCIWTDKHSVVTSSGLGDGSYDCYVAKNEAGQIIGIKIDYYLEDNEEDL